MALIDAGGNCKTSSQRTRATRDCTSLTAISSLTQAIKGNVLCPFYGERCLHFRGYKIQLLMGKQSVLEQTVR